MTLNKLVYGGVFLAMLLASKCLALWSNAEDEKDRRLDRKLKEWESLIR